MKRSFKDFINLIRLYPIFSTFVISISVMLTSYYLSVNSFDSKVHNILTIILGSLSFIFATAASNIFNQVTDLSEDKITKPYRPIPSEKFTVREAGIISIIFYFISISLSFLINYYFVLFLILFVLFTITYSVYPRVKKILILNQLWIGIARGFFLILGSWSTFSYPFENISLSLGLISCIFVFGGMSSKDISDAEADKKSGVKTLVNLIGLKKTAIFSLICMSGSVLLIIPLTFFGVFKIFHLLLLLFLIPSFYIFYLMNKVKKYSKFENVSAWVIMHASNFLLVLCFAMLTIIFS